MAAQMGIYTILFDEQLIVIEYNSKIYCGVRQNKTQGHLLINVNTNSVTRPYSSQNKITSDKSFATLEVYIMEKQEEQL